MNKCCSTCIHFLLLEIEDKPSIGECLNDDCLWYQMKRSGTEGQMCPDYEEICDARV